MKSYQAIERAMQLVQAGFAGKQRIGRLSVPASVHSLRVGLNLHAYGYPIEVILGGFCHDLVEDTDFTLETIRQLFNERVADLVNACSFNPALGERAGEEDLNQRIIARAASGDIDPLIIKCADAKDNLMTSAELKPEWQTEAAASGRIRLDAALQFLPDHTLTHDFRLIVEREEARLGLR